MKAYDLTEQERGSLVQLLNKAGFCTRIAKDKPKGKSGVGRWFVEFWEWGKPAETE